MIQLLVPLALAAAFLSATAVGASAQIGAMGALPTMTPNFNPSVPLVVPQAPEAPVSPTTPGTLPGTTAGQGTAAGTHALTGQPCAPRGALSISGAGTPPGAPVLPPGQSAPPEENPVGGPPPASVYGARGAWNFGHC